VRAACRLQCRRAGAPRLRKKRITRRWQWYAADVAWFSCAQTLLRVHRKGDVAELAVAAANVPINVYIMKIAL
jgi:hypothetical protein